MQSVMIITYLFFQNINSSYFFNLIPKWLYGKNWGEIYILNWWKSNFNNY